VPGSRRGLTTDAHEQRIIMICCRRSAACAAIVCAEATAQRVNIAPSPVSGNRPNSDSTSSTVHVTDSRHCAGKAAHDHTLDVGTHINFLIERAIGMSWRGRSLYLGVKGSNVCTLFNRLPGPPVGAPPSVRAPLEPIKGRACTLEHRLSKVKLVHVL
jgi:hypothetical protein